MSNELLLPIHIENEHCMNKSNMLKFIELTLLHGTFIVGDVYFSINDCNNPDTIINLPVYFASYAGVELTWIIYILCLISKKHDVVLSCNHDAFAFIMYNLFVIIWNVIGALILSDLMNYSCEIELYNYLFAKIIINYFYCVYKIFSIFYE